MNPPLKLMAVLAHPDDESLGFGPTLARYAAEGVETSLLMATRGHKGWKLGAYPGPAVAGAHRSRELERAAQVLGISRLTILDHMDGELDRVEPQLVIAEIAEQLRLVRPDVILTFGLEGAYGHPDHVAIAQFTSAAIVKAAGSFEPLPELPAHQVSKLYHLAETRAVFDAYKRVFGDLKSVVNGVERRFEGWPEWYPSAHLDTRAFIDRTRAAILEHRSQLRNYQGLLELPAAELEVVFGAQTFARVFSLVNAGRETEIDLFAGLRPAPARTPAVA